MESAAVFWAGAPLTGASLSLPETQFPGVRSMPIPGAKNPRQAQENAGALGWRLSDDAMAALDKAGQEISK